MRRIPLAFALVVSVAGCFGNKSPSVSSQTGVEKGVAGSYFYVNILTPPVNGSITASGATPRSGGIANCSSTNPAGCGLAHTDAQQTTPTYQTAYAWSDTVTLTATGAGASVLIAWAGDCAGTGTCTLSAGADKTVVAVFGAPDSGHPNFMDPAIHGPAYLASIRNANSLVCSTCHGADLDGQSIAPSCNDCHASAGHPNWQTDCNFCHGAPPPKYVGATPNPPHPVVSSSLPGCSVCHPETVTPTGTIVVGGKHMDGQVQFTGGHQAGFGAPSAHAPAFFDYVSGNGGLDCKSCHGENYELPIASGDSCNSCHATAGWGNWQTNCSFCHGLKNSATQPGGYDLALNPTYASPPDAVSQRLSGTPAPERSGAHVAHLTNNAFALAFKCETCHAVPSSLSHIDGSTSRATVTLDGAGQGSLPPSPNLGTYDQAAGTCLTRCHGTSASPTWSFVGLQCGSCHATPPATSTHSGIAQNDLTACAGCHPDTMNPDGTVNVAGGHHVNGVVEFSGGHPAGWVFPTAHGYSANQQGLQSCTSCHVSFGAVGGATSTSCNACHASNGHASWQTECTFCHGTAGRSFNQAGPFPVGRLVPTLAELAASPPVGPQGQTAATEALVGAHQAHVNPAAGARTVPMACTTCHATPLPTDVAHVNGLPVPVPFGGLAVTGGITTASFNPSTLACANTYCHGNFTGGSGASPVWTAPGPLGCTACHGAPPATASTHHPSNTSCGSCHTGYSSTTVTAATHVDGTVQKPVNGCTACHGVLAGQAGPAVANTSPTAAPGYDASAVDTAGNSARTFAGVGAHLRHLSPLLRSTGLACTECHGALPAPGDVSHATGTGTGGARATLSFGTLATTGNLAGAGAAYAGSSTATGGTTGGACSNTYCHGNFPQGTADQRYSTTPSWTGGSLNCTGCHAPREWGHLSHQPTNNGCADCHLGYTATSVNPALHMNGVKNVGGPGTTLNNSFDPTFKYCSNVACHSWVSADGW